MMPTSWMACSPSATWIADLEGLVALEEPPLSRSELLEVGALDVLHGDVAKAAVLAVLVDAADVAVRDLARELDLAT